MDIKKEKDTIAPINSILVIPAFVEYRLYTTRSAQYDLIDHGFSSKTIEVDSNYIHYPENAKFLSFYFDFKFGKKINRFANMKRPLLTIEDFNFLKRELARIKLMLKDSLVHDYFMSDSLYTVLSKYPYNNEILVDLMFLQNKHFYPKAINHWALIKLYVFDLKSKKLIFYNYKMETGGLRYDLFGKTDVPTLSINYLIKDYKLYYKRNKKYFKHKK